jgi:16S rRNA (adenine1518-N6/adenine1519-N6)-dimethyltransferase
MKSAPNKPYAKKSLGQNFLIDPGYVGRIIDALDLQKNDIVVEIGPGRGALTAGLIEKAGTAIVIEIDADLVPELEKKFGGAENFALVHGDALKTDFRALIAERAAPGGEPKAKLAANLPYYISTAILQHLASFSECFSVLVLMLQKEVVERITAAPGNRERGFLTVLTEAFFDARKLFDVPPNAFRPAPKVWSSVIRLTPKTAAGVLEENPALFQKLLGFAFSQKRKTIHNNLKNARELLQDRDLSAILAENGIDPRRRAETLKLEEWLGLTESFARRA